MFFTYFLVMYKLEKLAWSQTWFAQDLEVKLSSRVQAVIKSPVELVGSFPLRSMGSGLHP